MRYLVLLAGFVFAATANSQEYNTYKGYTPKDFPSRYKHEICVWDMGPREILWEVEDQADQNPIGATGYPRGMSCVYVDFPPGVFNFRVTRPYPGCEIKFSVIEDVIVSVFGDTAGNISCRPQSHYNETQHRQMPKESVSRLHEDYRPTKLVHFACYNYSPSASIRIEKYNHEGQRVGQLSCAKGKVSTTVDTPIFDEDPSDFKIILQNTNSEIANFDCQHSKGPNPIECRLLKTPKAPFLRLENHPEGIKLYVYPQE